MSKITRPDAIVRRKGSKIAGSSKIMETSEEVEELANDILDLLTKIKEIAQDIKEIIT